MNFSRKSWDGYYGTETETTYYDAWYEVRLQLVVQQWDDGNAIRLPMPARTTVVLIGNGSGARGLTRMRMVMFFQAALILRPLLKSIKLGRPILLLPGQHLQRSLHGLLILMVH